MAGTKGGSMILDDIRRNIAALRAERAGKRSLGFPEPRLVVLVGNRAAYAAARMHDAERVLSAEELATFEGCDVELGGCIGVEAVWRA